MKKKMLTVASLLFICFILAQPRTTNAQEECTIAISPSTITVDAPDMDFIVNVTIITAPNMDFYTINNITWDDSIIGLKTGTETDLVEGSFMKNFGSTVFAVYGLYAGRIEDIGCGFLTLSYANGSGLLFQIKFHSKAVGTTTIDIGYAMLLDATSHTHPPEWYLDPSNGLTLSSGTVDVIPEFSASILLPLLAAATLIAIIATKSLRKRQINPNIPA